MLWKQPTLRGISPFPRAGHKFVCHRDKDIYVIGGFNDSCPNMQTFAGVHKLSLGNGLVLCFPSSLVFSNNVQ